MIGYPTTRIFLGITGDLTVSTEEIEQLHLKVLRLFAEGKFDQAVQYALRARDLSLILFGEDKPHYVTSLNNLAILYKAKGLFRQARPLFEEALEIRSRLLEEDNPLIAISLGNLAGLFISLGLYREALPLFERSRDIMLKAFGEEHPNYAQSLINLAGYYQSIGSYKTALPLFEKSRDIWQGLFGKEPEYARSLHNLASLYQLMGSYRDALKLYEQAHEIRFRVLGEGHPDYATTLNDFAGMYASIGSYDQAISLFEETLEIRSRVLGKDHPDYAQSLIGLANVYQSQGAYDKALPLYEQALGIIQGVFGEEHPGSAVALNDLATQYESMGLYEKALPLFEKALAIRCRVIPEDHPECASSLNNLANLHVSMGTYEKALPLYNQTLKIWGSSLGEGHPNYATGLTNLGRLYVAQGRTDAAFDLFQQAQSIEDVLILQIISSTSDAERTGYLAKLRDRVNLFLSLVIQHLSDQPACVQAAFDLVLRRKGLVVEAMAIQQETILGGKYPSLKADLDSLTITRNLYIRAVLDGPGLGLIAQEQGVEKIRILKEQLARQEASIARQIPELELTPRLQAINYNTILENLPTNSCLLEFIRYFPYDFTAIPANGEQPWNSARYLVFVAVDHDTQAIQMIDLGDAEQIDLLVRQYIDQIRCDGGYPTAQFDPGPRGYLLASTLLDPIRSAILHVEHLIISPDGMLATLPFEVIPFTGNALLIDHCQVSYVSVGRELVRRQGCEMDVDGPGHGGVPLLVADPNYDLQIPGDIQNPIDVIDLPSSSAMRASLNQFDRLPSTRTEAQMISRLIDAQTLLDDQALESIVKAARSPRLLHVATHGFFLHDDEHELDASRRMNSFGRIQPFSGNRFDHLIHIDNPLLRSGLALAGVNTWLNGGVLPPEAEDGILTAEDVTGMDLTETDLVVLSACETGLGEIKIGEGVYGLRRSFAIAGAKTLVMSMWQVPDLETKELMIDFYTRLKDGKGRAAALREAQLAIKAVKPNPRYWGAFICQGDVGPLTLRS